MADILSGLEKVGVSSLGTQKQGKIRKPSARMQQLFPVLAKEANPRFAKAATGFTYTTETIFTIFAGLVIVQLFVRDPRWIIALHSARALALLTVSIMSAWSIYQGHSIPEVHIGFYMVELLVVLAVNVAALAISAVNLRKKRERQERVTAGDVMGIVVPAGLTLFNLYLVGQQLYRIRLGKRSTPVNQVFTLVMAAFLTLMSPTRFALASKNYNVAFIIKMSNPCGLDITQDPISATFCQLVGSRFFISIVAFTGSATNVTYIWEKQQPDNSWVPLSLTPGYETISTATTSDLWFPRTTPFSGTYRCTVFYVCGLFPVSANSGEAVVTIISTDYLPQVTQTNPTCSTDTGSITITPALGLLYSLNGGEFSSTLVYDELEYGFEWSVVARPLDGGGDCISGATTGTIGPIPIPTIVEEPTSVAVCKGVLAIFSVETEGTVTGWVWQKFVAGNWDFLFGLGYTGAFTDTLTVDTSDPIRAGLYRCDMTYTCFGINHLITNVVTLTIVDESYLPVAVQSTCASPTASVTITSVAGLEYNFNGKGYPSDLVQTGLAPGSNWTVVARPTNGGECTSGTTSGTIGPLSSVTIDEQPESVAVCSGENATFSVEETATGGAVITSYQWKLNGVDIVPNSNNYVLPVNTATLIVKTSSNPNVVKGNYTVQINYTCDGPTSHVLSDIATLTILDDDYVPTVNVQNPTCSTPTGTVTITAVPGLVYSFNGGDYSTTTVHSGLAPNSAWSVRAGISTEPPTDPISVSCAGALVSGTIGPLLTPPLPPVVISTCEEPHYTIRVTSPIGPQYKYSNNDGPVQVSPVFSGLPLGSTYSVVVLELFVDTVCESAPTTGTVLAAVQAPPTVASPCDVSAGQIRVTSPLGEQYEYILNPDNDPVQQASPLFIGLANGTYQVAVTNTVTNCTSEPADAVVGVPPMEWSYIPPTGNPIPIDTGCSPVFSPSPTASGGCCGSSGGPIVTVTDSIINFDGCHRTQTRTWTAEDRNADRSCDHTENVPALLTSQTITWINNNPPVITLVQDPSDGIIEECNPNEDQISAALGTATVTYVCSSQVSKTFIDSEPYVDENNSCKYHQDRVWTVVDSCGNVVHATATATWTLCQNTEANVVHQTCVDGHIVNGTITFTSPLNTDEAPFVIYEYTITNGNVFQLSPIFTNVAPGTYFLYATVIGGEATCDSDVIEKTVNPVVQTPIASVTTAATCANPLATVTITAPTGVGYTYSVDGGAPFTDVEFQVGAGPHELVAISPDGCPSAPLDFFIVAPTVPAKPTATHTDPTCPTFDDGTITVTSPLSTDEPPVTYMYSINGDDYQTSISFSDLEIGTYQLTVKLGECISTPTAVPLVAFCDGCPAQPTATSTADCTGLNGFILVLSPLSAGSIEYQYSRDGEHYQTAELFTGVPLGTYQVTAKIGDCVSAARQVIVGVNCDQCPPIVWPLPHPKDKNLDCDPVNIVFGTPDAPPIGGCCAPCGPQVAVTTGPVIQEDDCVYHQTRKWTASDSSLNCNCSNTEPVSISQTLTWQICEPKVTVTGSCEAASVIVTYPIGVEWIYRLHNADNSYNVTIENTTNPVEFTPPLGTYILNVSNDGGCVLEPFTVVVASNCQGGEPLVWDNKPVPEKNLGCNFVSCDEEPFDPTAYFSEFAQNVTASGGNCGACGTLLVTFSTGEIVNEGGCAYSLTRTWTAYDIVFVNDVKVCDCPGTIEAQQKLTFIINCETPVIVAVGVPEDGYILKCNPSEGDIEAALGTATVENDPCGTSTRHVEDEDVIIDGCSYSQTRVWTTTSTCGPLAKPVSRTAYWTVDTTAPVITATGSPLNGQLGCNPTDDEILLALGTAKVADVCDSSPSLIQKTTPRSHIGCNYSQTRIWFSVDACGNRAADVSRVVTWTEDVFEVPPNKSATVKCLSNAVEPVPPVVFNTCGDEVSPGPVVISPDPPGCAGTKTYTWTYTDCNGNEYPWVYTYTITGSTPVITTTGASLNVGCNPTPAAINAALGTATVTDACDSAPVLVETTAPETHMGCLYSQTRTWTATNDCGNKSQASRTATWSKLVILKQPRCQCVCKGNCAKFHVDAPAASYQWQRLEGNVWVSLQDNHKYAGTKTVTLTVKDTKCHDNHANFRVIVTCGSCTLNSEGAELQVKCCKKQQCDKPKSLDKKQCHDKTRSRVCGQRKKDCHKRR